MNKQPRVAFFSDSYHGVDGVATTCRNVVAAARARGYPMLAIHAANRTSQWGDGSVEFLELDRGAFSFSLDLHLKFDPFFVRHYARALDAARKFRAEVVHITGPGDVGITGARVAAALQVPLVAAWHTNIHEFAARRVSSLVQPLPEEARSALSQATERFVLWACLQYYGMARVLLAPNREHMQMLSAATGKPVFPMRRGVDRRLFSPAKRDVCDHTFRLGYVGRLCPEKNVRFLAEIERSLRADGIDNYRFLIVGEGGERPWLEKNLLRADFTGELHGEFLARAYANMDLFVFPSETDTYGNVVAEAMASGVPALVTSLGGPKFQVRDGVTGFIAKDTNEFISRAKLAVTNPKLHRALREATRQAAGESGWEMVLDDLAAAYREGLQPGIPPRVREAILAS